MFSPSSRPSVKRYRMFLCRSAQSGETGKQTGAGKGILSCRSMRTGLTLDTLSMSPARIAFRDGDIDRCRSDRAEAD